MGVKEVIVAVLLLFLLIEFILDQFPKEVFYTVESKKLPESFQGVKIVVVADLHNKSFGHKNERLIQKIKALQPDIILIAGDLMVRKQPKKYEVALQFMKGISNICPIYYGLGNHEQSLMTSDKGFTDLYFNYRDTVKKMGVTFLDNESVFITRKNEKIKITGVSIGKMFFQKFKLPSMSDDYLQNLVGNCDKKCYNILIAHNPSYFKSYIKWGADLIFSGHIHGGVIRIPFLGGMLSPQCRFFPKYAGGRYDSENQTMLVSRGLGGHTIKFRIFNRPEIMVVNLQSK